MTNGTRFAKMDFRGEIRLAKRRLSTTQGDAALGDTTMSETNGSVVVVNVVDVVDVVDVANMAVAPRISMADAHGVPVTQAMCDLEWAWYGEGTEVGMERDECDGIQVGTFLRDVGHMPRCAAELDAYSDGETAHAEYQAANPYTETEEAADEKSARAAVDAAHVVDLAAYDRECDSCVKQLRPLVAKEGEYKMRVSVLIHTYLKARLAGNVARTTKVRRSAAIRELEIHLAAAFSTEKIATRARIGATMALLFGAKAETPVVGSDGMCYKSLTKGVSTYSVDKIDRMSKLCVQSPDDTVESWSIIRHMDTEVRTLVKEAVSESFSRETIIEACANIVLESNRREVVANPSNQVAAKIVADAERKLAATKAAETTETVTVTETTETPTPTPETPASLINPVGDDDPAAAATDAETVAYDMHEFMADAVDKDAVWVAFLELCKDDDSMPADVKSDAIAMLVRRANRAANAAK